MSNSYMKSAYFQTQVNQANRIKECYQCDTKCNKIVNCTIPSDLTVDTLTVTGKATILGLIDPTGMEFTPVSSNPGGVQANTIWVNSTDTNKLYFGENSVGTGDVNLVTAGTNISVTGTATNPIVNFAPGGIINMNAANLTNTDTLSVNLIDNSSDNTLQLKAGANTSILMDSTNEKITLDCVDAQIGDIGSISSGTKLSINNGLGSVVANLSNGYTVMMNGNDAKMTSTLPILQVNSAAVEGVEIGTDGGNNIIRGFGLPLTIAQDSTNQVTDSIILNNTGNGDGGVFIYTAENLYANITKEVQIIGGEGVKITSAIEPSFGPSVFMKSTNQNCVVRVEAQGSKGGQIVADEGVGNFVFEGTDGFATVVQGTSVVSISTSEVASAIGMTAGPSGASMDIVANGDDTGKISMVAQTSGNPAELTIDGSSTVGIITATASIITLQTPNTLLDINGTTGDTTWNQLGAMTANWTGGTDITTPNFRLDTPELVFDNVPTATGTGSLTNWIKVKINGNDAWIPYLTSAPV